MKNKLELRWLLISDGLFQIKSNPERMTVEKSELVESVNHIFHAVEAFFQPIYPEGSATLLVRIFSWHTYEYDFMSFRYQYQNFSYTASSERMGGKALDVVRQWGEDTFNSKAQASYDRCRLEGIVDP